MANFLLETLSAISPEFQEGARRQRESDDLNKLRSLKIAAAEDQQQQVQRQRATDEELKQIEYGSRLAENLLKIPDVKQRTDAINSQIPTLQRLNFDAEDLKQLYDPDPVAWEQKLNNAVFAGKTFLEQNKNGLSASQREFQFLTEGMTPEQIARAKGIKTGIYPRATGSAVQTIAQQGIAQQIADVERTLAGGKESGKLQAQFKFKPMIQRAVKLAESEAKERGEVLTDLQRSRAALPGLLESVGELKKLAPIVTSNLTGRAFDAVVKELGFGSTKGATARKKFIAIVNNQVLPLLKPTFGAAFTVAEGEALRATMGDPNSTEDQKIAELDAFIQNKIREIETKERQLGEQPQGQIMQDANGNRAIVYPDGTFEEID